MLFAANIVWATAYDTMYAMTDREDDLRIGVKSTAVLLGRFVRVGVAVMQALALGLLWWAGQLAGLGLWYWIGLGLEGCTVLWQQFLIRERAPAACLDAFLNNSWFGAAVYCGVLLHYTFAT